MIYSAIIYARYNSSRLPGKVLLEFGNQTILGICVDKLSEIEGLNIIVATSDQITDTPIVNWCRKNKIKVFRGNLEDVASRTFDCLIENPCDAFFRINADSPYLQISLIEEAMGLFNTGEFDIITNVLERSYPYGIAVELVKASLFKEEINKFSVLEREHITTFFYKNPENYKIFNMRYKEDLSKYRFVLDTRDDLEELLILYNKEPHIFKYNLLDLLKIKSKN